MKTTSSHHSTPYLTDKSVLRFTFFADKARLKSTTIVALPYFLFKRWGIYVVDVFVVYFPEVCISPAQA